MPRHYYVYILANKSHGTIYIGVTSDLMKRIHGHRIGAVPGFTKSFNVKLLVHFEIYGEIEQAILREKRLKKWHRQWKDELIARNNPDWRDLWSEINGAKDPG